MMQHDKVNIIFFLDALRPYVKKGGNKVQLRFWKALFLVRQMLAGILLAFSIPIKKLKF
jgi:hypothetical protein